MKKRDRNLTIKIKFSNRWLYSLIAVGILIVIGVGVYATSITKGGSGTPGHNIQDVGPPTTCNSGEFLKYDGSTNTWACAVGATGPAGPQGPAGPAGPQSPVSTGLYGYAQMSAHTCPVSYAPVTCTPRANPSYSTSSCPSGYTLVQTGSSDSNYYTYFSCYKS